MEPVDAFLQIGDRLDVRERPHPRTGVADLVGALAPVEVDREHREPLFRQSRREVARVVGQAPHVVDHHNAGMAAAVGPDQEALRKILGLHGGQYTPAR